MMQTETSGQFRVVEDWKVVYTNPVKLQINDTVIIEKRETDPDWIGWVYCVDKNRIGGWVPEKYLQIDGAKGTVIRDYDATELPVSSGDMVNAHYEESGWVWAENKEGQKGWVPLRNLM